MRRPGIIVTSIMLFFITSCEKYTIPKPEVPEDISFSGDIIPIFENSCVSCHSGGIPPDLNPEVAYEELIDGGYVNTADPESSELYTKLLGSHSSRATEEEKLLILQWITEGALEN
jgi:hypothetical protein